MDGCNCCVEINSRPLKERMTQLLFEKANTLNKKGIQLFPRLNTEKKIFSGSTFSWRGRGGRGVVFATGREITVKNKEKSGLVIIKNGISIFGHLLKNFLLVLTLVRFLFEHFEDF